MVGIRGWALRFLGFVIVLLGGVAHSRQDSLSYAEIGNKLISSYGILDENQNQERTVDENGIPQLSVQEQRKLIFSILGTLDAPAKTAKTDFIVQANRILIDDIEFFYANSQGHHDQHLFSKFNHTQSLFGEAVLAKMLANRVADVATLRKRQAFVRELVANPELYAQVQSLVQQMKQSEPALLSFWLGDEAEAKQEISGFYYDKGRDTILGAFIRRPGKSWDTSPRALEVLTRWNYFWTVEPLYRDIIQSTVLLYIGNRLIAPMTGMSKNYTTSLWAAFVESLLMVAPLGDAYNAVRLYTGSLSALEYADARKYIVDPEKRALADSWQWNNEEIISAKRDALGQVVGKTYMFQRRIEAIKETLHDLAQKRRLISQMQTKLKETANFVENAKKIEELALVYPVISDGLMHYDGIKDMENSSAHSKEYSELFELLQTSTFKGDLSFFSYTGRVLRAYDLMHLKNKELVPLLQAYGELDACLSLATLVKKFENERVTYCFADYSETSVPTLRLTQFWNPQIIPASVVANDIELGASSRTRNMILTGSNTGGKSTLLKAIIINIQLGLTVGIVPAQSAIMSLFDYVGTTLNVVDNTAEGKSLYQAEVDRATGLIKAVQQCTAENKLCFLIMDELFRGTAPEKADQETYQCAKLLSRYKNTCYILATHFVNKIIHLQEETQGICKNYKVDVCIDQNGNVVRPFKLEEGVSNQNIAGHLLDLSLS